MDTFVKGDMIVADLFGENVGGAFVGDNLADLIRMKVGTGMVVDGGTRDRAGVLAAAAAGNPGAAGVVVDADGCESNTSDSVMERRECGHGIAEGLIGTLMTGCAAPREETAGQPASPAKKALMHVGCQSDGTSTASVEFKALIPAVNAEAV